MELPHFFVSSIHPYPTISASITGRSEKKKKKKKKKTLGWYCFTQSMLRSEDNDKVKDKDIRFWVICFYKVQPEQDTPTPLLDHLILCI
jgi:hypothetical protein